MVHLPLPYLHLLQLLLDPLAYLSSHPLHKNGTNSIILLILNLSVEKTQYSKLKAIFQLTLQLLRAVYVNVTQKEGVTFRFNNRRDVTFCVISSICFYKQLCLEATTVCFLWLAFLICFLSSFHSAGITPAPRCLH